MTQLQCFRTFKVMCNSVIHKLSTVLHPMVLAHKDFFALLGCSCTSMGYKRIESQKHFISFWNSYSLESFFESLCFWFSKSYDKNLSSWLNRWKSISAKLGGFTQDSQVHLLNWTLKFLACQRQIYIAGWRFVREWIICKFEDLFQIQIWDFKMRNLDWNFGLLADVDGFGDGFALHRSQSAFGYGDDRWDYFVGLGFSGRRR